MAADEPEKMADEEEELPDYDSDEEIQVTGELPSLGANPGFFGVNTQLMQNNFNNLNSAVHGNQDQMVNDSYGQALSPGALEKQKNQEPVIIDLTLTEEEERKLRAQERALKLGETWFDDGISNLLDIIAEKPDTNTVLFNISTTMHREQLEDPDAPKPAEIKADDNMDQQPPTPEMDEAPPTPEMAPTPPESMNGDTEEQNTNLESENNNQPTLSGNDNNEENDDDEDEEEVPEWLRTDQPKGPKIRTYYKSKVILNNHFFQVFGDTRTSSRLEAEKAILKFMNDRHPDKEPLTKLDERFYEMCRRPACGHNWSPRSALAEFCDEYGKSHPHCELVFSRNSNTAAFMQIRITSFFFEIGLFFFTQIKI